MGVLNNFMFSIFWLLAFCKQGSKKVMNPKTFEAMQIPALSANGNKFRNFFMIFNNFDPWPKGCIIENQYSMNEDFLLPLGVGQTKSLN